MAATTIDGVNKIQIRNAKNGDFDLNLAGGGGSGGSDLYPTIEITQTEIPGEMISDLVINIDSFSLQNGLFSIQETDVPEKINYKITAISNGQERTMEGVGRLYVVDELQYDFQQPTILFNADLVWYQLVMGEDFDEETQTSQYVLQNVSYRGIGAITVFARTTIQIPANSMQDVTNNCYIGFSYTTDSDTNLRFGSNSNIDEMHISNFLYSLLPLSFGGILYLYNPTSSTVTINANQGLNS